MPAQNSLFDDLDDAQKPAKKSAAAAPQPSGANTANALRLSTAQGNVLSPEQQRFNRWLARIEKLKNQLTEMETLGDNYRSRYSATLQPLEAKKSALMRSMALQLDERLRAKGLTAAQKKTCVTILCDLAASLAAQGQEDMHALHDQHSPRSLQQKQQDEEEDMRDMVKGMAEHAFGQSFEDLHGQEDAPESVEAMMQSLLKKAQEAEEAQQAQRAAKKAKKKPTATQRKAAEAQQDAEGLLRTVFRQLASSLHPDRERDADERARKTALMSEANVAYAKKDLVGLLQIQLRIEQSNPESLAQMAADKIAAMSLLLKQQVGELEAHIFQRKRQILHEFELAPFAPLSLTTLQRELMAREHELQQELHLMTHDLQAVQDDAGLKQWLKAQKKLRQELEKDADLMFF